MTRNFPRARDDQTGVAAEGTGARMELASPVVVITYPHSGAQLLTDMLAGSRSLACTSATGLLPLCHEAIGAWQQAEGRNGPPSPLAIKSVRSLVTTICLVIQAHAGARRWCETAFTSAEVARAFLRIFPDTTFLCFHRSLNGVFGEAIRDYPWGLGDSPFWAFSGGHPGNNAATIAAYWAARTESLLDLEAGNPDSCLRVRHEDLAVDRARQAREISEALGLDPNELAGLPEPEPPQPAAPADFRPAVPVNRVPPGLLTRIRDLHARLAYDPWPEH